MISQTLGGGYPGIEHLRIKSQPSLKMDEVKAPSRLFEERTFVKSTPASVIYQS
ncbi:MAG: hypothetical protein ACREPR_23510 [Brasilonema sp.]